MERSGLPLLCHGSEGIHEATENNAAFDFIFLGLANHGDLVKSANADLPEYSVDLLKGLRGSIDGLGNVAVSTPIKGIIDNVVCTSPRSVTHIGSGAADQNCVGSVLADRRQVLQVSRSPIGCTVSEAGLLAGLSQGSRCLCRHIGYRIGPHGRVLLLAPVRCNLAIDLRLRRCHRLLQYSIT